MSLKEGIETAKAEGLSDEEIFLHLQRHLEPKIQAARKEGHDLDSIHATLLEEGLPKDYADKLTMRPEPPRPPITEQLGEAVTEAARPFKKIPEVLAEAAKPSMRQMEMAAAQRLPGIAPVAERLAELPGEAGGAVARALARRGIPTPIPEMAGQVAGTALMPAGITGEILPKTALDLELLAAQGALTAGAATSPVLGQPWRLALRNIMRGRKPMEVAPGVFEAAATRYPSRPITEAPAGPERLPGPPAPAERLPAPIARPPLAAPPARTFLPARPPSAGVIPAEEFATGETFAMRPTRTVREIYEPRIGGLAVPAETGEALSAISRRLGIAPIPSTPAPVKAKAPKKPTVSYMEKITKVEANSLVKTLDDTLQDPNKTARLVLAIKTDKLIPTKAQKAINSLTAQYERSYRVNGPDNSITKHLEKAITDLGMKPVAPEVTSPAAPPAPIPPAAVEAEVSPAAPLEAPKYFQDLPLEIQEQAKSLRAQELEAIGNIQYPIDATFAGESVKVLGPAHRYPPYNDPSYGTPDLGSNAQLMVERSDGSKFIAMAPSIEVAGKMLLTPWPLPSKPSSFETWLQAPPNDPIGRIQEAAPAGAPPEAVNVKALEKVAGKKLWQMTKPEFEERFPTVDPAIHYADVEKAMLANKSIPEDLYEQYPELRQTWETHEKALYEMEEEQYYRQIGGRTPVINFIKKLGGLGQKGLEKAELQDIKLPGLITKKGLSVDVAAQALYTEGLLREPEPNELYEAVRYESSTNTPWIRDPRTYGKGWEPGAIFPRKVNQPPPKPKVPTPTLDKLDAVIKPMPVKGEGAKPKNITERITEIGRKYFDRNEVLKVVQKSAEKFYKDTYGKDMPDYMKVEFLQALSNSKADGRVEAIFDQIRNTLQNIENVGLTQYLSKRLSLEDMGQKLRLLEQRAERYLVSDDEALQKEGREVLAMIQEDKALPGHFNEDMIAEALAEIQRAAAEIHPAATKMLDSAVAEIQGVFKDLKDEGVDWGLVSKKGNDAMEAAGKGYIGSIDYEHAASDILGNKRTGLGQQYRKLIFRLKGSTGPRVEAIDTIITKIPRMVYALEAQKARTALVSIAQLPGHEQVAIKLKEGMDPPPEYDTFIVYEDGMPVKYAAHKYIVDTFNALPSEEAQMVHKILSLAYGGLRATAVTFQPGWIPGNFIRDAIDTLLLTDAYFKVTGEHKTVNMLAFGEDIVRAFLSILKHDELYEEASKAGIFMHGRARAITPEVFKGSLRPRQKWSTYKEIVGGAAESAKAAMMKLVDTFEQAPKLATYYRMKKLGYTDLDAAYEAANMAGTPPGQRRGATFRQNAVNQNVLFMFYNINKQGAWRLFETLKKRPIELGILLTAFAVADLVSLLWWLRQDQRRSVPDYEMENNTVLMTGGEHLERTGHVVPNRFTLPLSHTLKPIHWALLGFVRYLDTNKKSKLIEGAVNAATSLMPFNMQVDIEHPFKSFSSSIVSSMNPAISGPFEAVMNYDGFRQRMIESQSLQAREHWARYTARTSEIAKRIGRAFATREAPGEPLKGGISPVMMEHTAERFLGPYPRTAMRLYDVIMRKLAPGTMPPVVPYASKWEAAADVPIVGRFVGRLGGRPTAEEELWKFKKERSTEKTTAAFDLMQAISANAMNPSPQNKQWIQEAAIVAMRLDPAIKDRAEKAAKKGLQKQLVSIAYDLWKELPEQEQHQFVVEMNKTEYGKSIIAQFLQEMRSRPPTPPWASQPEKEEESPLTE